MCRSASKHDSVYGFPVLLYAQILPVALLRENKLECLIMKSFWTTKIFYLQVNYDRKIPH